MIGRLDQDNLSFITDNQSKSQILDIINSIYFEKKGIKLSELNDELNDLL